MTPEEKMKLLIIEDQLVAMYVARSQYYKVKYNEASIRREVHRQIYGEAK